MSNGGIIMSNHNYMNRIEVVTQCVIMATENNVGHPIYVQIFEYEKKNEEIEYGYLIKHRPFVDSDYIHPLDGIVLTCSDKLSETYSELRNVLNSEYGVDKNVVSSYLKKACK